MRWPARPNNQIVIQASNPRIPKAGGLRLAQTGDAGAGGVCFDAGPEGTGGRGAAPDFFHTRWDRTDGGLGSPWRSSKTGRRPLLGPSARLSRALSQKIGAPSMHTPGHTRSARPGTKKPGGPRRGVIVGRRASPIFYYPTGRGDTGWGRLAARRPDHRLSHDGAVLGDGRLCEDQLIDAPQKRVDSHAYLPA